MSDYPQNHSLYAFKVPFYHQDGSFSHFVDPESSFTPDDSGYLTLFFNTPEEAKAFLVEYDLSEEAVENNWLLAKIETSII